MTRYASSTQPTKNTEAYNLYLKGRYFWHKYSKEWVLKAIATYYLKGEYQRAVNLLNETIELEPNYMPTHFLLALVRIQEKCLAEDLFRRVGFLN